MKLSDQLVIGSVYTRKELKEKFNIKDATINNGVFLLRDQRCIWLFVTEDKSDHFSEYSDELRGDDLFMDGQNAGGTDKDLIEHSQNGVEVLLFYRRHKTEFPGGGFVYEGKFQYSGHQGTRPAHFHFARRKSEAHRPVGAPIA
jgi:putative restriction endonuclease